MKINLQSKTILITLLFLASFVFTKNASAETIYLDPQSTTVAKGVPFSLVVKIDSGVNVFGVNFNLNFDSNLFKFVNATEGSFLKSGCNTSMLVGPSPSKSGTIIFGISRLGSSCGGVSGSGTIATLNFISLNTEGSNAPTFSRNSICKAGTECSPTVVVGSWTQPKITVKQNTTANMLTASLFNATNPTPPITTPTPSSIINLPTTTAYPAITVPLRFGSKNSQAKTLQQVLSQDKSIYPEGIISGYFGKLTEAAVKRFQCKYISLCSGSTTTNGYGLVGPKTRAKINEAYNLK